MPRGYPLSNNTVHKNSVVDQIMKSVQVLLLWWLLTSDKNFIDIALALDSNLHKYPSLFLSLLFWARSLSLGKLVDIVLIANITLSISVTMATTNILAGQSAMTY